MPFWTYQAHITIERYWSLPNLAIFMLTKYFEVPISLCESNNKIMHLVMVYTIITSNDDNIYINSKNMISTMNGKVKYWLIWHTFDQGLKSQTVLVFWYCICMSMYDASGGERKEMKNKKRKNKRRQLYIQEQTLKITFHVTLFVDLEWYNFDIVLWKVYIFSDN